MAGEAESTENAGREERRIKDPKNPRFGENAAERSRVKSNLLCRG